VFDESSPCNLLRNHETAHRCAVCSIAAFDVWAHGTIPQARGRRDCSRLSLSLSNRGISGVLTRAVRDCTRVIVQILALTVLGCESDLPLNAPDGTPPDGKSIDGARSYDFGWVAPDAELTHEFAIRNESPRAWEIARVSSTCGCTTATPAATTIEPGSELRIAVQLKPGTHPGPRKETVRVTLADGAPALVLAVAAAVRSPVTVLPRTSRVDLVPGEKKSFEIAAENYSGSDWTEVRIAAQARDGEPSLCVIEKARRVCPRSRMTLINPASQTINSAGPAACNGFFNTLGRMRTCCR
jgi:hypothetical protein